MVTNACTSVPRGQHTADSTDVSQLSKENSAGGRASDDGAFVDYYADAEADANVGADRVRG